MRLFICEKPIQARDIAKQLHANEPHEGYLQGSDVIVTWCLGHLVEFAPPQFYEKNLKPWRMDVLPVLPTDWTKLTTKRGAKQFTIINKLLTQTNNVVIASDPDRAGETIVREILDLCDYKGKIERLWLSALDEISIQKALANLKPSNETINLYEAEKSRERSDYLIGMNMTMAASCLYGINDVLSLGRVQTPTLKLVVSRDQDIEKFVPQDYYQLKSQFKTKQNSTFWATWEMPEQYLNEHGYCINRECLESIAANIEDEPGIVTKFTQEVKKQTAPRCYSLSHLQKDASAKWGYGAKQVLDIVQSLYETHKAVTYPRTDCQYLPLAQLSEAELVLQALNMADPALAPLIECCDSEFQSGVWNDAKITAHHAIIPTTNKALALSSLTEQEYNIHDLIRRHYIAQFLEDYQYQASTLKINCAGEPFHASMQQSIKQGWKAAFCEETKVKNNQLPNLEKGDCLSFEDYVIEDKQTQPPAKFTEGALIEAMKNVGNSMDDASHKQVLKDNQGIGTEATRANIIEILFKRKYIAKKGKQLESTEKGRALIQLAPHQLTDPALTAIWESKLNDIAQGNYDLKSFVKAQIELLDEMLIAIQQGNNTQKGASLQLQSNSNNGKVYYCPSCDAPLRRLKNKKGNFFYGCSTYPACAFTTWEKAGKPKL